MGTNASLRYSTAPPRGGLPLVSGVSVADGWGEWVHPGVLVDGDGKHIPEHAIHSNQSSREEGGAEVWGDREGGGGKSEQRGGRGGRTRTLESCGRSRGVFCCGQRGGGGGGGGRGGTLKACGCSGEDSSVSRGIESDIKYFNSGLNFSTDSREIESGVEVFEVSDGVCNGPCILHRARAGARDLSDSHDRHSADFRGSNENLFHYHNNSRRVSAPIVVCGRI